ncbi:MAG: hypothetical protein PHY09_08475 [Desulfuromonadaceae bacterium]|nr:hypothetical protein [Desulfuromonadaceae bacterium]MDD5106838.1 hypothetical protein [Desulfuromonadaceae bacterium]
MTTISPFPQQGQMRPVAATGSAGSFLRRLPRQRQILDHPSSQFGHDFFSSLLV